MRIDRLLLPLAFHALGFVAQCCKEKKFMNSSLEWLRQGVVDIQQGVWVICKPLCGKVDRSALVNSSRPEVKAILLTKEENDRLLDMPHEYLVTNGLDTSVPGNTSSLCLDPLGDFSSSTCNLSAATGRLDGLFLEICKMTKMNICRLSPKIVDLMATSSKVSLMLFDVQQVWHDVQATEKANTIMGVKRFGARGPNKCSTNAGLNCERARAVPLSTPTWLFLSYSDKFRHLKRAFRQQENLKQVLNMPDNSLEVGLFLEIDELVSFANISAEPCLSTSFDLFLLVWRDGSKLWLDYFMKMSIGPQESLFQDEGRHSCTGVEAIMFCSFSIFVHFDEHSLVRNQFTLKGRLWMTRAQQGTQDRNHAINLYSCSMSHTVLTCCNEIPAWNITNDHLSLSGHCTLLLQPKMLVDVLPRSTLYMVFVLAILLLICSSALTLFVLFYPPIRLLSYNA